MEWNGIVTIQRTFSEPVQTTPELPTGAGPQKGKRAPSRVKGPHMVVKGLTGRFKGRARQRTAQVKDPPTEMNLRKMLECDN